MFGFASIAPLWLKDKRSDATDLQCFNLVIELLLHNPGLRTFVVGISRKNITESPENDNVSVENGNVSVKNGNVTWSNDNVT